MFWLLGPLGFFGLTLLLGSEWKQFRAGMVAGKLIASTAFLAFAVSVGLDGALETIIGRWILLGLGLCWLGDALLLPPGQSLWFRLGIGAFLLGHIAYATAFFAWGIDARAFTIAALAIGFVSLRVLRWLRPHRPDEFAVAVQGYVVAIGIMLACAVGAGAHEAPPLIVTGALAFAISDLSVARERFVTPSFVNSLWGLPLYYAAQVMIILGMAQLPEG